MWQTLISQEDGKLTMVILEREIWRDDGHKKRRENERTEPEKNYYRNLSKEFYYKAEQGDEADA